MALPRDSKPAHHFTSLQRIHTPSPTCRAFLRGNNKKRVPASPGVGSDGEPMKVVAGKTDIVGSSRRRFFKNHLLGQPEELPQGGSEVSRQTRSHDSGFLCQTTTGDGDFDTQDIPASLRGVLHGAHETSFLEATIHGDDVCTSHPHFASMDRSGHDRWRLCIAPQTGPFSFP